jgi:hypothetical protein
MDKEFEFAAKGWLGQYKADIKGKVENLLDENDACPEELAEEINVDVEEIYDILDGNAEDISVDTLIRVFMVLGLAVEIKPIEETPLGGYDNVNPHVMREPQREERHTPRPNPFAHGNGDFVPPFPPCDFDPSRIPPHVRGNMDKEFERRSPIDRPMPKREEQPTSPFAVMGRNELCKIIRKKLWDSEIDLDNATTKELVHFLEEKDKRMKAYKNTEELERDPKVADFVKNMKKTIKENPQFRSYMKQYLKNLDVED